MPSKHNTPPRRIGSPIDKAKAHEVVWDQVAPVFEAARRWRNVGFVYVIGEPDEGMLKIGYSKDPIGRLRGMQTGNPRHLRMEYALAGDMSMEKLLHQFWEPHAVLSASSKGIPGVAPGTEWFKPTAREQLLPIVADAVQREIAAMAEPDCSFDDLDCAVRAAHSACGFIAHYVEPTYRLAEGAGYVASRRIRI